jgi:hypothetical protein
MNDDNFHINNLVANFIMGVSTFSGKDQSIINTIYIR